MINVIYDRSVPSVTVDGHAKSGEFGHDLVCAACSILTHTLAEDVKRLCQDKRRVRRPIVDIREGKATVACSPIHGMQALTALTFDNVVVGYELLAREYPDNITFKIT